MALYNVGLVALSGQTFGKRVMKIKIVDRDGKRPSFARSLGRHAATYVSQIFAIGYLMAVFRSDKRAMHDLMADTWVVSAR